MIFTWMLYCTAVSALLGLGALALERGLGALRLPTRFAWAGAVLLSAALPFGLPALLDPRVPPPPREAGAAALGALETAAAPVAAAAPSALQTADLLLLPAWLAASAALLLAGCALLVVLRLRRLGWRRAVVAGEPVLVSPATGPAVVGFLRGRIVLPAWALEWDEGSQRLMVEHEREHLRARDPLLLLLALAAAAAVPWNAALWWQLRRLRLAMEVDCDARVLRRRPDVRAYGLLLLEVGRVATSGRVPVLALTEPPSFLERRIRTMTSRTSRRRVRRAALAAALCAGTVLLAAALPAPAAPVSWGLDRQPAVADTLPLPAGVIDVRDATDKPRLVNGAQLQRLLASTYPPALRDAGVVGRAEVAMVVAETGAPTEVRVLEATRPEFGEAAAVVMRQARFAPARRDGRPVAVRLQVPVAFTLERGTAPVPGVPSVTPPAGQGIVDVSALEVKPRLLNGLEVQRTLMAAFPPTLRDAGAAGRATVAFVVGADGVTRDAELVATTHEALGEPALTAVRAMRFTPGRLGGRATAARVQIPVAFTLERTDPAATTPAAPPQGT
jgi:TonB family protein